MDTTSCQIASASPVVAGAEKPPASSSSRSSAVLALASLIIRVAAVAFLACSVARSAWRARGDPRDLAFVAGAGAALAALFWCLRLAERLTPESPAAERWRLQAAVWSLSAVLSCAFAYRVSLVMPAALVVIVWGMTAFVVLAGFFMLVLCKDKDQQYQCLELDEADAGDATPFNEIKPTDQLRLV